MSEPKERYNIGLLVANITDVYSNRIARGAMRAAKRLDADLIIFPGKYLGEDSGYDMFDTTYEYQHNVLFDHAAHGGFDYLICAAGSIAYRLDDDGKSRFLSKFVGTPTLCLSAYTEVCDHLQYDNRSGIIEAIDLLAAEGRKNIGMMVGELNNNECRERYAAYRQGLEKNGLTFNERFIIENELSEYCHDKAAELIERAPELDAIICTNDLIATVVYEELKIYGKKVGTDVAVVGFDDLPFAAEMVPSLASVRADAELLGERAVERAVDHLNGILSDDHYLKTEFVPRQSCRKDTHIYNSPDRIFTCSIDSIGKEVSDYLAAFGKEKEVVEKESEVISALTKSIFGGASKGMDILPGASDIIEKYAGYSDIFAKDFTGTYELMLSGIKALKLQYPHYTADAEKLYTILSIRLSSCLSEAARAAEDKIKEKTHIDNIFIRDTLMAVNDNIKESCARILHRLSLAGSLTGFIYLFDQPIEHRPGKSFPDTPEWRFRSYCYGAETFSVPEEEQKISPEKIYKNKYLCSDRQHIFIVADLFSAEKQYGIALLEPEDAEFFIEFEMVSYQLSLAVKQLHSAKLAQQSLKRQEMLLEELHRQNLALEELSNIDELTGIYNRRGFYLAAGELLAEYPGKTFLVGYADMDSLKYVNDTYGHEEGDFCIRTVSECFSEALGKGAIIGRVGGDEFIGLVMADNTEKITQRKNSFISRFNSSGKKPYYFDVSMGLVKCELRDSYDLKTAVDRADDLLYAEKSRKKEHKLTAL